VALPEDSGWNWSILAPSYHEAQRNSPLSFEESPEYMPFAVSQVPAYSPKHKIDSNARRVAQSTVFLPVWLAERIFTLPPDCSPESLRGKSYLIGHHKGREQARSYNHPIG
jgi:hypothetical protein